MLDSPEKPNNPSISETRSSEIVIDGDELLRVFNSPQFKKGVTTLAGSARKVAYDVEGGFTIFRGLTNAKTNLVYMMIVGESSTGTSEAEQKIHDNLYSVGNFPLIALHFHPLSGRRVFSYTPSEADLDGITVVREEMRSKLGYDGSPLGVIAIAKGEDVDLVLYQGGDKMPTGRMLSFYGEDLRTNETFDDIIYLLGNYGFKSAIVQYSDGKVNPQSEDRVKDFAFTLRPFKAPTPLK